MPNTCSGSCDRCERYSTYLTSGDRGKSWMCPNCAPPDPRIGQARVNPSTGAVAVYRYGSDLTGPMWFVVPMNDDPRWQLTSDHIEEWPFLR